MSYSPEQLGFVEAPLTDGEIERWTLLIARVGRLCFLNSRDKLFGTPVLLIRQMSCEQRLKLLKEIQDTSGFKDEVLADILKPTLTPEVSREYLVRYMAHRFLSYQLPKDFNPDGGITATRPNYAPEVEWCPSGTNLLNYEQACDLARHMLEGVFK